MELQRSLSDRARFLPEQIPAFSEAETWSDWTPQSPRKMLLLVLWTKRLFCLVSWGRRGDSECMVLFHPDLTLGAMENKGGAPRHGHARVPWPPRQPALLAHSVLCEYHACVLNAWSIFKPRS